MNDYKSFLICFHQDHTDVFLNGLPLGVIRKGRFAIHEYILPSGQTKPVEISDQLLLDVYAVIQSIRTSIDR